MPKQMGQILSIYRLCGERRGRGLVPQFLFGLTVEFLVPVFWLSGQLPKLMGTVHDIDFNGFVH
jgi:hypothetical protein